MILAGAPPWSCEQSGHINIYVQGTSQCPVFIGAAIATRTSSSAISRSQCQRCPLTNDEAT